MKHMEDIFMSAQVQWKIWYFRTIQSEFIIQMKENSHIISINTVEERLLDYLLL